MGNSYRKGLTLERIDVNGDYCKENCRWATNMEQQGNKRMNRVLLFQGEMMHLADLCRHTGVSKIRLTSRLAKGMTPEDAVADALASTYGTGKNSTGVRLRKMERLSEDLKRQGRTFTT